LAPPPIFPDPQWPLAATTAGFRPRHLSGEQHPAGRGAEDFQHFRDHRWAAQDAGTQGLIEKGRLKRLTIMAADIG